MTSDDLKQLFTNRLARCFFLYFALSLFLSFLFHGVAYFHGGDKLTHVEFPLAEHTELSVDGDFVVTYVPYWNRIQIYHREHGFLSGFFLGKTAVTGVFRISPDTRVIDCTHKRASSPSFQLYSFSGSLLSETQSPKVVEKCSGHYLPTSTQEAERLGVYFQFDGVGYSLQAKDGPQLKTLNQRNIFADLIAVSLFPFTIFKVYIFLLGVQTIWFFVKATRLTQHRTRL
ncbi:hypothetical protein [Pseudovibrio ascidiaceicola]|uniref:hypothetical protein n=1 Tax=Pseudovibrio ascidiaceicola TaxID=285279 RepID=UPI001AD8FA43|nr:hypothetical protein [Pseudovibrio ascidiaceicola]